MSPIRNARILLGVFLFCAAVLLTQFSFAQVKGLPAKGGKEEDKKEFNPNDGYGYNVNEQAKKKIESVKMHLKEDMPAEDWKDIIFALQGLLNEQRDSLYDKGTKMVSVRVEVNRIIGTFSKQGREFYQGEVGPGAADALKQALASNNFSQLAEISERYFHTKAGAEATVVLGKYYLDRGRYSAAASTFARFTQRNPDEPIAANVLFMAAYANKRLALVATANSNETERKQYEARAEEYWTRLVKELGNKEVAINGKKMTIAQLEAEYKKPIPISKPLNQSDWYAPRGNYTNNAQGNGSRPFLDPLWQIPMMPLLDPSEKANKGSKYDWIDQNLKQALTAMDARPNLPPIPAFYPIASQGKVIFRNYEGVFCLTTRDDPATGLKAGEMNWMTESEGSLCWMLADGNKKQTLTSWWNPYYFQSGPLGIFFENGLLGSLTHDGTNVYFVDDLAVPPHPQYVAQNFGGGGFNGGGPITYGVFDPQVKSNKLVAINMETGKLKWKAGGPSPRVRKNLQPGEDAPETPETILGDALFLGPPLPINGKLYVVLEKDRELRLICIDPNKVDENKHPEVVWSQPLGSPNVSMPNDTLRRIQGINLAYSDNVLVCPTNAGAILGVDFLSHSLVWAKSYKAAQQAHAGLGMDQPAFIGRRPFPQPQPNQMMNQERWRTSTPIIANGKVVFAAYDSTSVICLNLRDGEQLWEVGRGADDLYIAGVFDNRVMVVSRTSVRFLDLNDKGKQIGNIIPIGTPSGIGTASKDIYYLPIKSAPDSKEPEVWSINVMTGVVEAKTHSRKKAQTGNLLFFDGAMFAQNAFNVSCYPLLDLKIAEMKARLAKDEKDPIGLAEMGDLLLDDGKLLEAITTLKRSLDNKPNDETKAKARKNLYEAITELLQKDFNAGETYVEEYKQLCNVEIPEGTEPFHKQQLAEEELRRKSNMFCLIAKGKESQGKLVEAFENYMSFGALAGSRELVPSIDQPGTLTRPDVWALGRINNMLEKATPQQRAPLEKKAMDRWLEVEKKGDLAEIRGFVRVFGTRFRSGNDARLLLADKLIATNSEEEVREAENILLSLKSLDEVIPAARAIEALARLYIRKGLLDDAVALYAELGKNYTNVKIRDNKTGGDFFNELITDKRFLPYLEPLRNSWGNTTLKAEVIQNNFANTQQQSFTIEPDGEVMPYFNRHRIMMDMNYQFTGQWVLKVIDRVNGEEKYKSNPMPPPQYIFNYPQTNNHKFAQIRGHLLILNLNNMVYAFDLADKVKLWEYNLFGKTPPPQPGPVRQDHEPDGVRLYYQDGWTQKVGHIGVIEASYICMITREGLVAVDPAKGTVLWTKNNVSSRVQLMGDESHVFIFESNQEGVLSSVKAIRASDGAAIDVPDATPAINNLKRTKIFGRRVLIMDEHPGDKKTLRLYDVLTGKDDWKRELTGSPMLIRSDDRNLSGYVTEKGDAVIFNIKDGKEIFTGKMDAPVLSKQLDKVSEVLLLSDRDRFYIMLNRPIQNNFNQNPSVTVGIRTIKVNGVMYAFDRITGKRLWYTDEQLENQELVLEQFQELPVMIGCHQYALLQNGAFVGTGMKVVALDKKTGKALVKPREVPPNLQFHALTADPKTSTIEFIRQDYRLKFTPDTKQPTGMLDKGPPLGLVDPPKQIQLEVARPLTK
jgi:outer membrane protein assembly factor BamB